MKIAFWSPLHGQTCTTTALLSVAMHISLTHPELQNVIMQSHFTGNQLDYAFLGTSATSGKRYLRRGLDAMITAAQIGDLSKDMIMSCTVETTDRLHLITMTGQVDYSIYAQSLDNVFNSIADAVDQVFDLTLIDVNAGNGKQSINIRNNADIVVVCLNQSQMVVEDFFENGYPELIKAVNPANLFFLIGNYDSNSKYNLHNLSKKYKKMKTANCGAIVHNVNLADSISDGQIIRFFKKNIGCTKGDANFIYMDQLTSAVNKLLNMVKLKSAR